MGAAKSVDVKTVLVVSPDLEVFRQLALHLDPAELRVVKAAADPGFLNVARTSHAAVAVVDLALGREAARLAIALLRDVAPAVRVIALSAYPALGDAAVVEDGVYYYLAEPAGPRLVQVVEAAARAVPAPTSRDRG